MILPDRQCVEIATLSRSDQEELQRLSSAVYPASETAHWPGRLLEWSKHERGILIRNEAHQLVSYVGMVVRSGRVEGSHRAIGGIGGVKTLPTERHRGYARLGITVALEFFRAAAIDFALLVCEPHLLEYYGRQGWKRFDGRLMVMQYGRVTEFTFNPVMTFAIRTETPAGGTIDLNGPPW